jgi:hypothetical protein
MERDPHISKLIRESGVKAAPENFTASVMDKIAEVPEKKSYKPLIGRGGRIFIILLLVAVIVLAVLYTEPAGELLGGVVELPRRERQAPQLQFNLDFLNQVNFSAGVAAGLLALFILILSDAGLSHRRRLSQ